MGLAGILVLLITCASTKYETNEMSISRFYVLDKEVKYGNYYFDVENTNSDRVTDSQITYMHEQRKRNFDYITITRPCKNSKSPSGKKIHRLPLNPYFQSSKLTVYKMELGELTGRVESSHLDSLPIIHMLLGTGNSEQIGKAKFIPIKFNHYYKYAAVHKDSNIVISCIDLKK